MPVVSVIPANRIVLALSRTRTQAKPVLVLESWLDTHAETLILNGRTIHQWAWCRLRGQASTSTAALSTSTKNSCAQRKVIAAELRSSGSLKPRTQSEDCKKRQHVSHEVTAGDSTDDTPPPVVEPLLSSPVVASATEHRFASIKSWDYRPTLVPGIASRFNSMKGIQAAQKTSVLTLPGSSSVRMTNCSDPFPPPWRDGQCSGWRG